jgi:hypothetical protein
VPLLTLDDHQLYAALTEWYHVAFRGRSQSFVIRTPVRLQAGSHGAPGFLECYNDSRRQNQADCTENIGQWGLGSQTDGGQRNLMKGTSEMQTFCVIVSYRKWPYRKMRHLSKATDINRGGQKLLKLRRHISIICFVTPLTLRVHRCDGLKPDR